MVAAAATAAAVVMVLSGCSLIQSDPNSAPEPKVTISQTPPPGSEALAPYYSQKLAWKGCGVGQCAQLRVPLDYANPAGESIEIAVLRMRATRPSQRIGSLVVNPGGPGGSGVDYARAADFIVGRPVRQQFDIVGFDPRGVQRSAPVDCLPDSQMDGYLGRDPTPDTTAEQQQFQASSVAFGRGCQQRTGALIGHVSTIDAAKDMDILRSALGDAKLNYLGKSYGTFLGATYADLFPTLVGRFVLDGVVAPDETPEELALGQAEGFETATRAWAADCVDGSRCPLGSSVDEVMAGMRTLLKDLDAKPIPVQGQGDVTELTEGWAATGIAEAMYDQREWDTLTAALRDVLKGDGTALMDLADQYAERNSSGQYTGNLLEAFPAVTCLDAADSPDLQTYAERAVTFSAKAPTWGALMAWGGEQCGVWPVKAVGHPHVVTAQGSGPIVVVGTTRDPATPYESSVRLHDQLANARLITYDGDGHTAYGRSNSCVDDAIDTYYTQGIPPKDGLTC
jgi:pimeloyl-ACP methyl ester carboxylesterase